MSHIPVPIHETRDASYEVHVGRGALDALPGVLGSACPAERYAVIADHHVAELHGARLMELLRGAGIEALLVTFPAGEWNKSREQWSELTDRLLAARLGRDSAIVAFGGGVAGDLAGFVAATYLRGIPYVQVPTTLLAMIDSSVGGKTGVDTPAGKNLVGAFHQPRAVVADVDLLATLPRVHVAAGLAEAVKHGVMRDVDHLADVEDARALLAKDLDRLETVVRRSVAIKAEVVAADEREAGLRAVLNFGHTVAHAVESCSGYAMLHGEAVAIGMAVEAAIAESVDVAIPGTRQRVVAALERCSLPTRIPAELDGDALRDAMLGDKKVRAGAVRLALPRACGEAARDPDGAWTHAVPLAVLRQALDSGRG
jgi:3-dehydroquinate synthase